MTFVLRTKLPIRFSLCQNLFKKSKENEDFSFPSTSRVQSVDRREEDKGSDSCDSHVGSSGAASAKNSSNRSKDKVNILMHALKIIGISVF